MPNNSKCFITGNLVRDPVMNTPNGNSVVSFTVGVNTTKKEGDNYVSDFYNVSVWGKTGEYIYPRLQKGSLVQVFGELQLQKYTDKKTGEERQALALRALDVTPLAKLKTVAKQNDDQEPFF